MDRITAELLAFADAQRRAVLAAVDAVPAERRDTRHAPAVWSAAEVLEHLHRVERGVVRLLTQGVEQARAAGAPAEPADAGALLASLDAFRLTDRTRHIPAPERVVPRGELTAAEALVRLGESREALRAALVAGDGLALGAVTHAHPLLGTLTLHQWVLFLAQHEARHAAQLRDIAAATAA